MKNIPNLSYSIYTATSRSNHRSKNNATKNSWNATSKTFYHYLKMYGELPPTNALDQKSNESTNKLNERRTSIYRTQRTTEMKIGWIRMGWRRRKARTAFYIHGRWSKGKRKMTCHVTHRLPWCDWWVMLLIELIIHWKLFFLIILKW